MDAPGGHGEAEIIPALRDIERVNLRLGGISSLWRPLRRLLAQSGIREFSLLDVGTGGGDVPRALVARARAAGMSARAVGVDRDAATVAYARSRTPDGEVTFLRADALALPFDDRSFDIVTSAMMLHHFDEPDSARLLAGFARVARRAVVVSDLRRHRLPWAVIRILAHLGESPMFRHDAPLSVLKGWTAEELRGVAGLAGHEATARVERVFPYRLVLTIPVETSQAAAPPPPATAPPARVVALPPPATAPPARVVALPPPATAPPPQAAAPPPQAAAPPPQATERPPRVRG